MVGERLLTMSVVYSVIRMLRQEIVTYYAESEDIKEREQLQALYKSLEEPLNVAAQFIADAVDDAEAEHVQV